MNLRGRHILVIGLGVSGIAAIQLCLAKAAIVTAVDKEFIPFSSNFVSVIKAGAFLVLGEYDINEFNLVEIIVISPGVDHRLSELVKFKARGGIVISEIELGYRFLCKPSIMITGTNGKSTVTTLISDMLEAAGYNIFSGGNLGIPLCQAVIGDQNFDWAVLEVSSFQIDTSEYLKPKIGVLLNITHDHMDRYNSFEDYVQSKYKLFACQDKDDIAILCFDDIEVYKYSYLITSRIFFYGVVRVYKLCGWLEESELVICLASRGEIRLSIDKVDLIGNFNYLNLLAASITALACDVAPNIIQKVINSYKRLKHRLQWIATINSVDYFDDSKGTNIGAVKSAIIALARPIVLLLGGRDKGACFIDLINQLKIWVRVVICFGEAGKLIHKQIYKVVFSEVVDSLSAAVERAYILAHPGEVVLLSPGCSSFDSYTGYVQRGEHFQFLVKKLK